MSGASDYSAKAFLDWVTGKTAMPALTDGFVALFTAVGVDAGTGFTEVTGGSYARADVVAGSWNAASGSAPSTASNSGTITFPTATADWGTVIAFGIYDAASAGNLKFWDYLGNFTWLPVTVSSASPGVITAKAHGYSVADLIIFSTEYGGTAPSFSQSNFTGQLAIAHAATDTLDVTNAATQVNTSSTGSGMIRKISKQVVSAGVQATFTASNLTLSVG